MTRLSSFIHCGPTRFWYASTDDNPDAEADLLMIIDGRTVVCEVKSSWASLRASHIDGLAALALKLRANTALLAIMEPASNRQAGKIAEAGAALEAAGIKLRVMSLTSHPLNDEPYLA
jgi:hypothetical protein